VQIIKSSNNVHALQPHVKVNSSEVTPKIENNSIKNNVHNIQTYNIIVHQMETLFKPVSDELQTLYEDSTVWYSNTVTSNKQIY